MLKQIRIFSKNVRACIFYICDQLTVSWILFIRHHLSPIFLMLWIITINQDNMCENNKKCLKYCTWAFRSWLPKQKLVDTQMLVNSLSGLHNFAFLVPFSHYLSILSKKIVKTSKYPTQSTLTEQLFSFFCKIKIIPIVNDYKFLVVSIQEQYFQLRLKITRPWSKSRN